MNDEERIEVETVPDNMEEVGDPFDLENVEYIMGPGQDSNSVQIPSLISSSAGGEQTLEEAFSALSSEHDMALGSIKKLKAELNQANAKILQLEDQVASGALIIVVTRLSLSKFDLDNGALVSRIKDMMSENLSEGFRRFELDFAEKMGKEVRVENSRLVFYLRNQSHGG